MLQALVLTAAILMTIWSLLAWFVSVMDWHQHLRRHDMTPSVTLAIAALLWITYCHL